MLLDESDMESNEPVICSHEVGGGLCRLPIASATDPQELTCKHHDQIHCTLCREDNYLALK